MNNKIELLSALVSKNIQVNITDILGNIITCYVYAVLGSECVISENYIEDYPTENDNYGNIRYDNIVSVNIAA